MATLKSRLALLEAKAPDGNGNFCLVVHGTENCANARSAAIASYVAEQGREPVNFFDVVLVSAQTKRSVCGCPTEEVRQAACTA